MVPGEGAKLRSGSSALMRHSMAWPNILTRPATRSFSPVATRDLHLDQVDAGDLLGHRVLDLDARVHLHEVEVLVGIDEELHRAGVLVADRFRPSWIAASLIAARSSGVRTGLGLSSRSFWWRRWIEHSRSPTRSRVSPSPRTWISMWRGRVTNFSMYTSPLPKAASASLRAPWKRRSKSSARCGRRASRARRRRPTP